VKTSMAGTTTLEHVLSGWPARGRSSSDSPGAGCGAMPAAIAASTRPASAASARSAGMRTATSMQIAPDSPKLAVVMVGLPARGKSAAWFSDRSACYLAAGRPVIVQDTGIGRYLPTGTGVLTFHDIDSAAEALERVERDYAQHAAAAHDFARSHLDSNRVLTRLLELAGI
jgi:hypothetical protein